MKMILYVIAFFCLIGGIDVTGNDQCVVPFVCPKEGRTGFISVPNEGKLPSSLFCPNKCSLREACKKKLDETRKVLDHELNTLAKEFTEMNELLKKKLKVLKNTTSTGDVTTAAATKETHPSENVSTSSTIEPIATTDAQEMTSEPTTNLPIATQEMTSEPSTNLPIATQEMTSEHSSTMPITTQPSSKLQQSTRTAYVGCGPLYNRSNDSSVCRDNPTAKADRCEWTRWYSRDDTGITGDVERLTLLRTKYPGEICRVPTCIQARLRGNKKSYNTTGDIVRISPCTGFSCRNAEQPGCATSTTRCCENYEVRFCCPTAVRCIKGGRIATALPERQAQYKIMLQFKFGIQSYAP